MNTKDIIRQDIVAQEWVQKEIVKKLIKTYTKDTVDAGSMFQLLWCGLTPVVKSMFVDYLKRQSLNYNATALTYLKLHEFGWFEVLADFGWDKLKSDIEEKFENSTDEEREIFLIKTEPYFKNTDLYISLKDKDAQLKDNKI